MFVRGKIVEIALATNGIGSNKDSSCKNIVQMEMLNMMYNAN